MMSDPANYSVSHHEKFITLAKAAEAVGARCWQLQRAIKRGDIPSYSPFKSRKLVKLSEVVAFIEASRQGGDDV
mgnify:FL=1